MKKIKKLLIRNIIILGPQGSGKGTQAELIAKKFHLRHIETGQMLRKIATRSTSLGKVINRLINQKGKIVPDRLMTGILKTALKNVPNNTGIVFDGYPRTLRQAKILEAVLRSLGRELTHVFYLPISQKTTIKRLSLRRMCKRCGTIFILGKNLKQGIMRCPKCGGEIYQRPDDRPRVIRTRLREYYRRTKPVVGYYKINRLLIEIDGEPPIPEVYKNILKRIQQ